MKQLFLCCSLLFSFGLFAQNSAVAGGAEASGPEGNLSFSVGQTAYTQVKGTQGSLNEGVQQTYSIFELMDAANEKAYFNISVAPNPTTKLITLEVEKPSSGQLSFQLFDLNGRVLSTKKIEEQETPIDMTPWASGSYILKVLRDNTLVSSFKIIKNN